MNKRSWSRILISLLVVALAPVLRGTPLDGTVLAAPDVACSVLQPDEALGLDAYIKQDKPNEVHPTNDDLIVKTEDGHLNRALLQFDVASVVPAGATVTGATLSLWVRDATGGVITVNAHQLLASWDEADVSWAWRDKSGAVAWSVPGGDYAGAVVDSAAVSVKNVWVSWNLTDLVAAWASGAAPNYGVILEAAFTVPKAEKKFASSHVANSALRPKLEVCYSQITLEPDNEGDGVAGLTRTYPHTVHVGNLTGEVIDLSATSSQGWTVTIYADADGNGVPDGGPISATPPLGPDEDYDILVRVAVPGGTAAATEDQTTVTATGQASGESDQALDRTTVTDEFLSVAPDHAGKAEQGDLVAYGHSITNNGDVQDCLTVSAVSSLGWSVQLWADDGDGVREAGEVALVNPVCLPPGATFHLGVEIQVPPAAAQGIVDQTSVTAQSTAYPGESGTATDTTEVCVVIQADGLLDAGYQYAGRTTAADTPGKIYQRESCDACCYALVIDRAYNDNVFGDYAETALDGWANGHTLDNLVGSDKATFSGAIEDCIFVLDYISVVDGQWGLGGNEEDIPQCALDAGLQYATSMLHNATATTYGQTYLSPTSYSNQTDSPPLDYNCLHPGDYYEFDNIYEFCIDKPAGGCQPLTVASSHNSPNKDAQNDATARLGNFVWLDANADGVQNDGTNNISPMPHPACVYLFKCTDQTLTSCVQAGITNTDAQGEYWFNYLEPGWYYVDIGGQCIDDGFCHTVSAESDILADSGSIPDPDGSDPPACVGMPAYSSPRAIQLVAGQTYTLADFGYYSSPTQVTLTGLTGTAATARPLGAVLLLFPALLAVGAAALLRRRAKTHRNESERPLQ